MLIKEKPAQILTQGPEPGLNLDASRQNLEDLYQTVLNKNLHEIKQEKKEQESKQAKTWTENIKDKMNQLSKILFSRESTYRGIIDILAEELPSLVVESLRGTNSVIEHVFKYIVTTSIIMGVPYFAKFFSSQAATKILKNIDPKQHGLALLFNREDLETKENFEKAKTKIIKEEVLDQMNLIRLWGIDSEKSKKHLKKAEEIKDFVKNLDNNEAVRKEALELKDEVVKKQTLLMSVLSGAVPYTTRLFRKFALGINRFTGSQKYLNDKDANKLGNKGFTLRQGLGTLACMFSSPLVANNLVKQFNETDPKKQSRFVKMMSKQLDTRHSFFPKIGTYIVSSSIPYLISRLFNAQDKYEFLETVIKSTINGGSLFFGDRATNGRFAKSADKELSKEHGSEPGILYHPEDPKKGFWSWLANIFPEARQFPEIIEKTQDNKELQKDAINKYQSSFLKGFFSHSFGIALVKFVINKFTQSRVEKDLEKLK